MRNMNINSRLVVLEGLAQSLIARSVAINTALIVVDSTIAASSGLTVKTLAEAATLRRQTSGPATVEIRRNLNPPAASYDFRDANGDWNTTFLGVPNGAPGATIITWASGTVLQGVVYWTLIKSVWGDPTPLQSPPDGTRVTLDGTILAGGGLHVRALNATASGVDVAFINAGAITTDGSSLDASGASSLLVVIALATSGVGGKTIPSNCLVQGAGTTIIVVSGSASSDVSLTQAGIPGGLVAGTNLFLQTLARNLGGTGGGIPAFQGGTGVALVAGTATINSVKLTANSIIQITRNTRIGTANNTILQAPAASRSVAGSSFVVQALNAGAVDATDTSTFDWLVVNL